MQRKSLVTAKRLFQRKKFKAAIKLLEPQVFQYRESFPFYYILGTSCLYVGDFGGALSYLRRAHQLREDHIGVLLGLAAIAFKRQDTDEAIKYWLRVLERDAYNRRAKQGLQLLKTGMEQEKIQSFIDSGKMERLFPRVKKGFPLLALLLSVCVGGIILGTYFFMDYLLSYTPTTRVEIERVTLFPSNQPLIDFKGDYAFNFTEQEVSEIFNKAKNYFFRYRDNLAVIECNRLINSNAVMAIKEKAKILKSYAKKPTFLDFKDALDFEAAIENPLLYDGCYVMWKGKVTNLIIGSEKISFDFLVGYHEEKEFKGVVPVEMDFAAKIENGYAMELLAQFIVQEKYFYLKVTSLRRLMPENQ